MIFEMSAYWTNESVLDFARDRDPIEAAEKAAQDVVFGAVEKGWEGPPFDPLELAEILGIEVVPKDELLDARTLPIGRKLVIEYNPTRPKYRVRFSLAHELAHTLFPDVARVSRYRNNPAADPPDGWQLELLCNIIAAEFLMPADTLPALREGPSQIEHLLELREAYGVSTEVLLRRATKLATYPVAMFAAAHVDPLSAASPFRIDYTVPSRAWRPPISRGERRPAGSVLSECTAVGFTAKDREDWSDRLRDLLVQAVGTPPFPGQRFPRVLGLLQPHGVRSVPDIEPTVVHGDATKPHGSGARVIVHLVNDKTPNWGGEFARALRREYPEAQDDFRVWAQTHHGGLRLGDAHITDVGSGLYVATIVGQHGYGPSARPRIRYAAVRDALLTVAHFAKDQGAAIHMPRLGAGQAGGRWLVIREIIEETLTRNGTPVKVYVPPGKPIEEVANPAGDELRLDV